MDEAVLDHNRHDISTWIQCLIKRKSEDNSLSAKALLRPINHNLFVGVYMSSSSSFCIVFFFFFVLVFFPSFLWASEFSGISNSVCWKSAEYLLNKSWMDFKIFSISERVSNTITSQVGRLVLHLNRKFSLTYLSKYRHLLTFLHDIVNYTISSNAPFAKHEFCAFSSREF